MSSFVPFVRPAAFSRGTGLDRLSAFLPQAGRAYARHRNEDRGAGHHAAVSGLSPWLRRRLILEPEVAGAALNAHGLSGAEKFIQEVFWRSYFKGWLEHRPAIWQRYQDRLGPARDRTPAADLRAAETGQTKIACFDDWIQELIATGYLHNHARMWTASIWIFTLRLPWELGADLFLRHLADGDPASNTLSWRWVAGLHTRGKHYLARADNIARFTGGRFHPVGELEERAGPLDEDAPMPPPVLPDPGPGPDPDPPFALLIHDEDGCSERLPLPGAPHAVARLPSAAPAGRPKDLADAALADAADRASQAFAVQVARPADLDAVLDWVATTGVRQLVTAYAPVGPTADRLGLLDRQLKRQGVGLVQVMRDWDARTWPHATKGFFGLKKQIPKLLSA